MSPYLVLTYPIGLINNPGLAVVICTSTGWGTAHSWTVMKSHDHTHIPGYLNSLQCIQTFVKLCIIVLVTRTYLQLTMCAPSGPSVFHYSITAEIRMVSAVCDMCRSLVSVLTNHLM